MRYHSFTLIKFVPVQSATMLLPLLLLTSFFILTIYHLASKWQKIAKHWEERGVKYVKPVPYFGNMFQTVTNSISLMDWFAQLYKAFPEERYCGLFQFTKPILLVRDPELIKEITIKNFEHFVDHAGFMPAEADPMWGKNLFASNGERWRDLRQSMSPVFTGSKMRSMFVLMDECAQQLSNHFKAKNETNVIDIEMKDVSTRYMNDMIASTALGLKCDSLKDEQNEYFLHGRNVADLTGLTKLKMLVAGNFPTLAIWLQLKIISSENSEFYKAIVVETIKMREQNKIIRPDLIYMLMEARKGKLKYEESQNVPETGFATVQESEVGKSDRRGTNFLSDDDITAQALIFYLGGFDTASSLACFTAYELALNPDVQSRLRDEINEAVDRDAGEKVTYEKLMAIKYLDMVICESLRKWSQATWIDRKCTRAFTIRPERPGEKPLKLEAGDVCWMPISGIHMDPKYYPNPEKFDPERFSDENKANITATTYFPFGVGPRNCIGNRFALMENKILFFYLLRDFEIVPTSKTQIPLKISKSSFTLTAENGFHLGLKRIC